MIHIYYTCLSIHHIHSRGWKLLNIAHTKKICFTMLDMDEAMYSSIKKCENS